MPPRPQLPLHDPFFKEKLFQALSPQNHLFNSCSSSCLAFKFHRPLPAIPPVTIRRMSRLAIVRNTVVMACATFGTFINMIAHPITLDLSAVAAVEAGVGNVDAVAGCGGTCNEGKEGDEDTHVELLVEQSFDNNCESEKRPVVGLNVNVVCLVAALW